MSERVWLIGAGSSGIASCQVLGARGIDFDCFEVGSEVGGNWRYMNDIDMAAGSRQQRAQRGGARGVPRVLPIASGDQQRLVIRK